MPAIPPKIKEQLYQSACKLASAGKLTELSELLARFDTIDCAPPHDYNLFHYALNHTPIIAYLTDTKLTPFKKFNDGTLEIHAAAFAGRTEEILSLIEKDNTALSQLNLRGEGVFYWLAVGNHLEFINTLLQTSKTDDNLHDVIAGATYLAEFYVEEKKYLEAKTIYQAIIFYHLQLKNTHPGDIIEYQHKMHECLTQLIITPRIEDKIQEQPEEKKTESIFTRLNELKIPEKLKEQDDPQQNVVAKWGFITHNIDSDGNCLFAAISHQIQINQHLFPPRHQRHNHHSLRQLAVQHLRKNVEVYRGFFGETALAGSTISIDEHIQEYLAEMARPGSWADHLTIVALVAELQIALAIILKNAHDPIIVKAKNPIAKLYIIYENYNHYQSTSVLGSAKIDAGLGMLIDQAPVDGITEFVELSTEQIPFTHAPSNGKAFHHGKSAPSNGHVTLIQQEKIKLTSGIATFQLMSRIAAPTCSPDTADKLIKNYNISPIQAAVLRSDWDSIEELLTSNPKLIDNEGEDTHTIFYWAALVGNAGIIQLLVWQPCFLKLESEQKAACYRDAAEGAIDRAENLCEDDELEPCAQAYEFAVQYAEQTLDYNADGYDSSAVFDLRERLFTALDSLLEHLLAQQKLVEAIVVKQKLITCYSGLNDVIPETLQLLTSQLADLQAQQKTLDDLNRAQPAPQQTSVMTKTDPGSVSKKPLVKTLFANTPPVASTNEIPRQRKRCRTV